MRARVNGEDPERRVGREAEGSRSREREREREREERKWRR